MKTTKKRHPTTIKKLYPSEFQIQCAFNDLVQLYGQRKFPDALLGFAIPNGGMRPFNVDKAGTRYSVEAKKLTRMGVRKGPWDWMLPVPVAPWHGLFIEFKDHKGRLTPEQIEFGVAMAAHGYLTLVMDDAQTAWESVVDYLRDGFLAEYKPRWLREHLDDALEALKAGIVKAEKKPPRLPCGGLVR